MFRRFFRAVTIFLLAGCAHRVTRDGLISKELPVTVDDLAEIKDGVKNHEKVLWEYKLYESPKLQHYCNAIAASLAEASTRPHLPYQVFLLDSDEVNVFGGPGGYIYITRGLFDFVESESELAGAIAHEITHVARYDYAVNPKLTKMQNAYNLMLQGTELAKSSIGTYGTAANLGMKGLQKAGPVLSKRFGKDEEVETDTHALDALIKAGYDPRGYLKFVEKLTKVEMDKIEKFANFMNAHPPFATRMVLLNNRIAHLGVDQGKIIFKKEMMLSEVRQTTVNASDSIVFQPNRDPSQPPLQFHSMDQDKKDNSAAYRDKRWAWF